MVRMLASTRNEPFSLHGEDMCTSFVCPSPQSSLETGPCFVSPQDHDVAEPDTVPPDPVLHLNTNECGVKNCRVSIPIWDANPLSPGDIICCPSQPPEVVHRGSSLRYHTHQQGWTLMDAFIKRASGQSAPSNKKETCPVGLHRYLYQSAFPTHGTLVPCTITVRLNALGFKHEVFTPTNNKHKIPDVI
jgi:hypothetical protein